MTPLKIGFIGMTALAIVSTGILLLGVAAVSFEDRFEFNEMITRLDSSQIVLGSDTDAVLCYGKPVSDIYKTSSTGEKFGLMVYNHDYEVLMLYRHGDKLFAAHHIVGVRSSTERWYFCDKDLLSQYIDSKQ